MMGDLPQTGRTDPPALAFVLSTPWNNNEASDHQRSQVVDRLVTGGGKWRRQDWTRRRDVNKKEVKLPVVVSGC